MSVTALAPRIAPTRAEVLAALGTRFAEGAAEADRLGRVPVENFAALHEAGLIGLPAPRELGGGGADLPDALEAVRAIGRGEPATALILVMTWLFLAGLKRLPQGIDPVRRRVAEDAIANGALVNALRVEPELGTPARGGVPATIARRDGDVWRISGRKIYSTGCQVLSWMLVWAVTDERAPRVGSFLVHRTAPGWRIEETWDHLGLRASGSHDVVFEETPTPVDHGLSLLPVGAPPPPFDPAFAAWNAVLIAGLYDGVAQAAFDWFLGWAATRTPANLGSPLASLPRFQEAAGAAKALLLSNQLMLEAAARGTLPPTEANLVKHSVTENAIALVQSLLPLTGNPGLSRANPLERHLRNALCGRVHTPQSDAVLGAAGRAAFAAVQG